MDDKEKIRKLVGYILHLMEGDDYLIEEMYEFLHEEGWVDEDGFEIVEDDDEELPKRPPKPKS